MSIGKPGTRIILRNPLIVFMVAAFIQFEWIDATASTEPGKIAFAATTVLLGKYQIYVMNADGANLTRLTSSEAGNNSPTFSPDGRKIAFVSGKSYGIFVINADGTGLMQLTHRALDVQPKFSPDGRRIVFKSFRDCPPGSGSGECGGIYVMSANGTGTTRLTHSILDQDPRFSPDGRKIIFTSNFQITVMNTDGSSFTPLTRLPGLNSEAVYSPDGNKIAFVSGRAGHAEIYVMNADGTGQSRLTDTWGAGSPDWR